MKTLARDTDRAVVSDCTGGWQLTSGCGGAQHDDGSVQPGGGGVQLGIGSVQPGGGGRRRAVAVNACRLIDYIRSDVEIQGARRPT